MHSALDIIIIQIYLQEQYIEAKNFNNEEDGPSEEDKTKNLNQLLTAMKQPTD